MPKQSATLYSRIDSQMIIISFHNLTIYQSVPSLFFHSQIKIWLDLVEMEPKHNCYLNNTNKKAQEMKPHALFASQT
jgi:hypothetical protein